MSEKTQVTNKIMKWAKDKGIYCVKNHGSGFSKVGTPDLFLCLYGNFVAIECKKKGEEPTAAQLLTIQEIKNSQGFADWFDDAKDAISWLEMVKRTLYGYIHK